MKLSLFLILTLLCAQLAQATHLIGGYIQAKSISGSALTYEITVSLYMDQVMGTEAANQAMSVSVCFGDGTSGIVSRQSQVVSLNRLVSLNTYRIIHTYAGASTYALSVSIPNRTVAKNIPNADYQPFHLNTTIVTNVTNQSPAPGFPEAGFHIGVNQKATILLKATDAEGDSLVYSLTKPLTSTDKEPCLTKPVPAYQFPNDVTRQGTFKLNSKTGELVWNAPVQLGNHSIALYVLEYRNGILISQTTQEITLVVDDLPGFPSIMPPYEPAVEGAGAVVTAITDYVDSDMTFTTFPNPVDDWLQVLIQSSNASTAVVQLVDINGRKLHESVFTKMARKHEQIINMSGLTSGVYFLRADVNGRPLLRKIVKK
ncbi:T9SS type A sorting domain-containing protein [Spirosoma sp.]|uniref:T9SS type A sorting domain-containing protein n=1 Tax=Spirosoma sp. TaxID=1899569 RepID=UPI003B3B5411